MHFGNAVRSGVTQTAGVLLLAILDSGAPGLNPADAQFQNAAEKGRAIFTEVLKVPQDNAGVISELFKAAKTHQIDLVAFSEIPHVNAVLTFARDRGLLSPA
jgi:hypothetical protein